MKNQPVRVECLLHAPAPKVWQALTDKDEMKNWYFELHEFIPKPGFQFEFTGGPSPEKQYIHVCEVNEVIRERKLAYSWSYQGYEGKSFVSFELFPQDDQTLVKLTHQGLESFPKENPDFAIHNFEEGWDEIINSSLKKYVEWE